jgi:hypothetical protein
MLPTTYQGVADRGASVRIGRDTEKEGKGKFYITLLTMSLFSHLNAFKY